MMLITLDLGMNKYNLYKDRHNTCDRRRTKQLTQAGYEKVNTPPEFNFGTRYAHVVANIWITMTYSSGMPFVYIIQFFSLLITYWIDKYLSNFPLLITVL